MPMAFTLWLQMAACSSGLYLKKKKIAIICNISYVMFYCTKPVHITRKSKIVQFVPSVIFFTFGRSELAYDHSKYNIFPPIIIYCVDPITDCQICYRVDLPFHKYGHRQLGPNVAILVQIWHIQLHWKMFFPFWHFGHREGNKVSWQGFLSFCKIIKKHSVFGNVYAYGKNQVWYTNSSYSYSY